MQRSAWAHNFLRQQETNIGAPFRHRSISPKNTAEQITPGQERKHPLPPARERQSHGFTKLADHILLPDSCRPCARPIDPLLQTALCETSHSAVLAIAILRGNAADVETLVRLGATVSERYHWILYQACLTSLVMAETLLISTQISPDMVSLQDNGDIVLYCVLRTP